MLKLSLYSLLAFLAFAARAEDKTCAVKGMHCTACAEMVTGKVCDDSKYAQCEVKILNADKELGQIHLVTKTTTDKVDEKALGEVVKDAGYSLQKCKVGKAKASAQKANAEG